MKVLSILGSPNGERGNTGLLLSEVLKGAKEYGAECEIISLKGDSLKPCTGCNLCHKRGFCHLKDDFEHIKEKMFSSDCLIFATPNYIFNVSAQLKVFFDRCASLIHCMFLMGKYGAAVVTSGGGDEKPIVEYLNYVLTVLGVTPVDSVWASMGTTKDGTLTEKACQQAFNVGKNLVEAWNNKIQFSSIERLQDMHKNRMKDLIKYYKDEWTYEYEYWKNLGQL